MADILVRFEVNPDGATEKVGDIKSDNTDLINNVGINVDSTGTYIIKPDGTFKGTEMLSLATGKLKFNESGYLANSKTSPSGKLQSSKNPRAYVWGATNKSGQLIKRNQDGTENVVNLTITIQKTSDSVSIDKIVLIGDKVAQQFPTEVYLDGNSTSILYSDDANFAIQFDSASDTHTITITRWNRPNYNATLTQIRAMLQYLEYDKASIDSLSSLIENSTDLSSVSYSVLASSGKGKILDKDTEIRDLVESGMIKDSGLKYQILFNGNPIRNHIIDSSSYLYNEWDFSSTDELKNASNGVFNPTYDDYRLQDITVKNLLSHIIENSTPKFTFRFADKLSELVYADTNLKNIDISQLASSTLEQIFNYICEITQSSMIIKDKELTILSSRPSQFSEDEKNAINIPIDYVIEDSGFSYIVNNKYDKVNYTVNKDIKTIESIPPIDPTSFTDNVDYNTAIEYIKERSIYDSGDITFKDIPSFFEIQNEAIVNGITFLYGIKNVKFENYTKFVKDGSSFPITTFYTQPSKSHKDIKFINFPLRNYGRSYPDAVSMMLNDANLNSLLDDDNLIFCGILEDENSSPFDNYVKSFYLMVLIKKTDNIINRPFRFLITSQSERESMDNFYVEKIKKEQVELEFSATNLSKNPISFKTNPLLTDESTAPSFNSNILEDVSGAPYVLSQNIFLDYYNNVVYSKKVKIYIGDFYNMNGELVKNNKNGEIISVGDVIYFKSDKLSNGNYILWRVFAVDFIYDGEPYLDLSLASINSFSDIYGLFKDGKLIKSWDNLVKDGDVVLTGNSLAILSGINKNLDGTLKIHNSVSSIQESALSECKLDKVGLPYGFQTIGYNSFSNSLSLKEISIPDTVTNIDSRAFAGCSSLIANFYRFDFVSGSTQKSSYTAYLGNENNKYRFLIMPTSREEQYGAHPSTKMIASYAFKGITELKSITLNDGLEQISSGAFESCTSLKTINFPSSLRVIGGSCFSGSGIEFADLSNLIYIETITGFSGCGQLESVWLYKGLKGIGLGAFSNCSRLMSLIIPENVREIGNVAFRGCKQLQSIFFGSIDKHKSKLERIGESAFYQCFQNDNVQDIPFIIPATCNFIGTFAFYDCYGLSKIEFKDPTGWRVTQNIYETGTAIDLSDPIRNVTYLTDTYRNYYFVK